MKSIFKKIVTRILTWESRAVVRKYSPTIIAVTGSVGKTSTKDAIFAMITSVSNSTTAPQQKPLIRKSDKSFNSEIGVPLTILGLENGWSNPIFWFKNILSGLMLVFFRTEYPKCLVLEVGADHPGDIKGLVKWLNPDISVITAVSKIPVHVEFFSSPAQVLDEKLALARGVKATGKIVLPAADPSILAVRNADGTNGNAPTVPCLTFGIDCAADVSATTISIVYSDENPAQKVPVGMSFKLNYLGNSVPVVLHGAIGNQHIHSLVAGAAAALAYGTDVMSIVAAIATYRVPRGRMNVLAGIRGSTLVDDTYNSSPDAVREALATLKSVETSGRKIAVLGDMMELGTFSVDEHRKIGELVVGTADFFVTVGIRARDMALSALALGFDPTKIKSFDTSLEAAAFFASTDAAVGAGDIVLIKGSQSPRLERVTSVLLADPARAADLLVRQEAQWLAR